MQNITIAVNIYYSDEDHYSDTIHYFPLSDFINHNANLFHVIWIFVLIHSR